LTLLSFIENKIIIQQITTRVASKVSVKLTNDSDIQGTGFKERTVRVLYPHSEYDFIGINSNTKEKIINK
jgi:hypothetical protein